MVSKDTLSTWSKTVVDHGAIITDDINHANLTHFVCAYRTSERFRQVWKRGNIRMVTAHWLSDVLQRKKMFVPNLAIHYPSPFEHNEPDKLPLAKYFFTMTGFEGKEDIKYQRNQHSESDKQYVLFLRVINLSYQYLLM